MQPYQTQQNKAPWTKYLLVLALGGGLASILFCIVCIGLVVVGSRPATPTPVDRVQDLPTQALRNPASTPKPLPTVQNAKFDADEIAYLDSVAIIGRELDEEIKRVSEYMTLAANNIDLLNSSEWRQQMKDQATLVKSNGLKLRGLQPPRRLAEMHGDLSDATKHSDRIVDLLNLYIATKDKNASKQLSDEITLYKNALMSATNKLDALGK